MQVRLLMGLVFVTVSTAALGCGGKDRHGHEQEPSAIPSTADLHHHDHQAKGPHGGHLIELGDHDFKAELVLDDGRHAVTVYLLDSEAAASAPGDGPEVRIQLFENGQFVDYTLNAIDPVGNVPEFSLVDEKLHDTLAAGHVRGRLHVTVGAKVYNATLDDLCDDHDGHDHD